MGETHVFKTAFAKYFSLAFIAVSVIVSAAIAWQNPGELTQSVPILLAIAGVIAILFYLPRVEVSDSGITIVNVLRTTHVPWPNFVSAEGQWNLLVTSTEGEHTAWALPPSSGTARRLSKDRSRNAGTRTNTAQGAAWVIAERFNGLKKAGYLNRATLGTPEVSKRINQGSVIAASVVVVLLAIGIL